MSDRYKGLSDPREFNARLARIREAARIEYLADAAYQEWKQDRRDEEFDRENDR